MGFAGSAFCFVRALCFVVLVRNRMASDVGWVCFNSFYTCFSGWFVPLDERFSLFPCSADAGAGAIAAPWRCPGQDHAVFLPPLPTRPCPRPHARPPGHVLLGRGHFLPAPSGGESVARCQPTLKTRRRLWPTRSIPRRPGYFGWWVLFFDLDLRFCGWHVRCFFLPTSASLLLCSRFHCWPLLFGYLRWRLRLPPAWW